MIFSIFSVNISTALTELDKASIFSEYIKDLSDDMYFKNEQKYIDKPIEELLPVIRTRIIGNYFFAKLYLLAGEYRWSANFFDKIAEWQCKFEDEYITPDDTEYIERVFVMKWFSYYCMNPSKYKSTTIECLTQYVENKHFEKDSPMFDRYKQGIRFEALILLGEVQKMEGDYKSAEVCYKRVLNEAFDEGFPIYSIVSYYHLVKLYENIQKIIKEIPMEREIRNMMEVFNLYNLENKFV